MGEGMVRDAKKASRPEVDASDPNDISSKPIELFFGLAGPTGVDLSKITSSLQAQLKAVGYEAHVVRLSELIHPYIGKHPQWENEFGRIDSLMTEGTKLRQDTGQADIVGRLGVAQIRALREEFTGDANKTPDSRIAYIVRSFKRPEEISMFREVYGKAFTLISVYAPRTTRIQYLTRLLRGSSALNGQDAEELAVRLVTRDYEEDVKYGQQLGRTFPLADYFVTSASRAQLDSQLRRLVRLTFGDPYISPTQDEQGMFFAQASALRSLDLSRQVGAAVISQDGEVIATGCNEVPKFGGGLYWANSEGVARDFEIGHDSNVTIKTELIEDAVRRLRAKGWLSSSISRKTDSELAKASLYGEDPFFRDSRLFDVIEFGRAVYAEMAAITQAAKIGVPLLGSRLFCTTFPCHICARHIVASGIGEVIFIEPYEKSRTDQLFADSVSIEPHEPSP
ncbi:MAG: anti-phage dCTP deaminase, partial [Roseateles sp.]|uniref:anti-phage dCTP deaminase n=1 Tax=Roseateles sp. TaxID=1971397 RepID=UPI004035B6A8